MNKELNEICRTLRRQGWTVSQTRKGHLKLMPPNGRPVFAAGTPSDSRSLLNMKTHLRRVGAQL